MIGSYFTSPMPGPSRFGSFTCTCAMYGAESRMTCGIVFDSDDIAFTSRFTLNCGEFTRSASSIASAAVLTKSVSCGPSGSNAYVTPRAAASGREGRKTSSVHAIACSRVTPGRSDRCFGEPTIITLPPRSAHRWTSWRK